MVAEAEIALASRDLNWPSRALTAATTTLEARGDVANAAHARTLVVRTRLLLMGRLDEAERALTTLDPASLPPALRATHELAIAGLATRRLRIRAARAALARAGQAARAAGIHALMAEVESATRVLNAPAACGSKRSRRCWPPNTLVVGRCRNAVHEAGVLASLARRPVLFTLARILAEAWPSDVPRNTLVARAFRARHADESHRARLRVEIGRLRRILRGIADIEADAAGFQN